MTITPTRYVHVVSSENKINSKAGAREVFDACLDDDIFSVFFDHPVDAGELSMCFHDWIRSPVTIANSSHEVPLPEDESGKRASVPFMVTKKMKFLLNNELGMGPKEMANLTPEEAFEHLKKANLSHEVPEVKEVVEEDEGARPLTYWREEQTFVENFGDTLDAAMVEPSRKSERQSFN